MRDTLTTKYEQSATLLGTTLGDILAIAGSSQHTFGDILLAELEA